MTALARLLYRLGLGLLLGFSGLAILFAAGETMGDPGGWKGMMLVGVWVVPMLGLALLAWQRPDRVERLLVILVAGAIAVDVWAAFAPHGWRSLEGGLGPVRAIVALALVGALTVFVPQRRVEAARLLLALGLVPLVLAQLRPGTGSAPLSAVSTPVVVAGGLLVASALLERHRVPRHPTSQEGTPHRPDHRWQAPSRHGVQSRSGSSARVLRRRPFGPFGSSGTARQG